MKKYICLIAIAGSSLFQSCTLLQRKDSTATVVPIQSLTLMDTFVIPHHYNYKNTIVGGLSGITYNDKAKLFYVISDDKSEYNPARLYALSLKEKNKQYNLNFEHVLTLLNKTGRPFPSKATFEAEKAKGKSIKYTTPDPEDVVYRKSTDQLVWVNEGARIVIDSNETILLNPSINLMDMQGRVIADYQLPKPLKMTQSTGPKHNKGFESVTISPSGTKLFTCTEYPLLEEMPVQSGEIGYTRILQYRDESRSVEASYAYPIHQGIGATYTYGVVALAAINDSTLYVLERAYNTAYGVSVQLYVTTLTASAAIKTKKSLLNNEDVVPLKKQLVYDFKNANTKIDNIEGMTFGPKINGKRTMMFVSDNNFSDQQQTIFYLFTIN